MSRGVMWSRSFGADGAELLARGSMGDRPALPAVAPLVLVREIN